jgi:Ni/Co efflux regulator RcnB
MKALIKNIVIGAAGLVIAAAPLAASAQDRHDHGRDQRAAQYERGGDVHRDWHGGGYVRPVYRTAYRPGFVNGYFGWSPGGFQGYYWNGGWYHHRRWNGGVWIYF